MHTVRLTTCGASQKIRIEILTGEAVVAGTVVQKGQEIIPALDKLLNVSKLDNTNVAEFLVVCEPGSSHLSCRMAQTARDIFSVARSFNQLNQ